MKNDLFKKSLQNCFEEKLGDLSNIQYAYIELDGTKTKDRIEYPGYDKDAQRCGNYDPELLPGFRSYVRIVLFINQNIRNPKIIRKADGLYNIDNTEYYNGNIFLLIANSVLSKQFRDKSPENKFKELIKYSKYTVKQLDKYGYMPICYEFIPEINGCLPEQIYPHSDKYLKTILEKIKSNTIEVCQYQK